MRCSVFLHDSHCILWRFPDMLFYRQYVKNLFLIAALFCSVLSASAQEQPDTLRRLTEVTVFGHRSAVFQAGTKTTLVDTLDMQLHKGRTLSELMQQQNLMFMKVYGPGALATSAFRGANASQTALLWNGFNLNSPMNGQHDFSLLPVLFFDQVEVEYGSSSSIWGSGSMAGAIQLRNRPELGDTPRWSLVHSVGSFSDYFHGLRIDGGKKRWKHSLKAFYHTAQNDFPYHNYTKPLAPLERLQHAEVRQYGVMADNYYVINPYQKINLRFWYQNNERSLSPTLTQPLSDAMQHDIAYRSSAEWQYHKNRWLIVARSAWFNEELVYFDSTLQKPSQNLANTFITETEATYTLHENHLLQAGLNNTYTGARAGGYGGAAGQNRSALFGAYKFRLPNGRFAANVSLRQELIDADVAPFVASAGAELRVWKYFRLRAMAGKSYRMPTFNDLYWNPGGNPDLLPEEGWNQEAGLSFQHERYSDRKVTRFETSVTAFNRRVHNWIIWLPGPSYWSPQNIMEVWSRGTETTFAFSHHSRLFRFGLNGQWNYVLSTNEKTKSENDASLGKQLIYSPRYYGSLALSAGYKRFTFRYIQSYTGYRFISSDNRQYMNPFTLGSLNLLYDFAWEGQSGRVTVAINNLFGEEYQLTQNRPMPLANFQVTLTLNLANNSN